MPNQQIKKIVYSQDAGLKRVPKKSGETSINLSQEIVEFIYPNRPHDTTETPVSFLLYKEDFLKGIAFVMNSLPLYRSSSKDYRKVEFSEEEFKDLLNQVDDFFGEDKTRLYTVNLLLRSDGRIYLNGLKQGAFSLRNFLVQEFSLLVFERTVNGQNELRIVYDRNIEEKESESLAQGSDTILDTPYRQYITAIKSKPFLLLAGISGTGKSRIVRELARSCWDKDSEEYKTQKPRNFEMIQVKPNWHDSSELFGYVSRINGETFVVGPFLKFMVRALKEPDVPYFLCLDEMNLAPVEQYFAEYLSVIESRKLKDDGFIETDPIVDFESTDAYHSLITQLFPKEDEEEDRRLFLSKEGGKRLSIPPNLIVVGTVNMDETTFSFSRKVLDRAMTIEMNEVDLWGGLTDRYESIERQSVEILVGTAVEGVDVYASHQAVCDTCLTYLQKVNEVLEETPFKVAYRTRNEVLLYVVNNLPYNKSADGTALPQEYVIARALDEITNMKILSRIEGDESKVRKDRLDRLVETIREGLESISGRQYGAESMERDDSQVEKSISIAKLKEMTKKLTDSGYTSYWS